MLTKQRKQLILSRLKQDGQIVAATLSTELGLSEDTIRRDLRARCKVAQRSRGGQGAAMHALQMAFGRERAQVAANGVFRQAEFGAERGGDDLPVLLQAAEDELLALLGEHAVSVHEKS